MEIVKPIIILGAPRSGTTLLYSIFSSHPDLWSLYSESEGIISKYFYPAKNWDLGNELNSTDATEEITQNIRNDFYKSANNYQLYSKKSMSKVYTSFWREKIERKVNKHIISPIFKPKRIRIVEKTPKNCVRVPFIDSVFPDAYYVFLTRDPRSNISSLMDGWRESGRYETYKLPERVEIEGYTGEKWNFILPPRWQQMAKGHTLAEVCAFQYRCANQAVLNSFRDLPDKRKTVIKYEDLVSEPTSEIKRICKFVELAYFGGLKRMAEKLPPVNSSTSPDKEKWKRNDGEVTSILDSVKDISEKLGYSV